MRELRFRVTGLSEDGARKRRRSDRRPARAKGAVWALVGLAALYVLGVGKFTGRVEIISPPSGTTTLEAQILVSGRVADTDADTVTLNVNGSSQTLPAPGGLFAVQVSLVPGENIISASADGYTSPPIKIIRSLRPVVTISSPSRNTATTQNPIEVNGVVENRGDRAVTLEVNGTTQPVVVMGERFSATLPLEVGRNIIRALVPDALPAEVVVSLETDIAITSPPDGSTIEQETVSVTGTVANSNAAAITLKLNESRQTIAVRNGVFASNVVLRVGANRIQALLGDKSSNEIVVNRTLPPVIITLTSPQSGSTQDSAASVRGTIQNTRSNRITVRVNDSERVVPVTGSSFTANVDLAIGKNVIRALQGDFVSYEVVVNREPPPAVAIQITSPQSGATRSSFVRVTGTITYQQGQTVTLTVNGSARTLPISNGGFTANVGLAFGDNHIRASQGNAVSNEVVVKRITTLIEITSPQSGGTRSSSVRVTGTITNSQGQTVTLTVNGSAHTLPISNDGGFASDVKLDVGANRIRALQGEAVSNEVTLRRLPPRPSIQIISPRSGQTKDSAVTVIGRVENAPGDTITLTVNGAPHSVKVIDGSFTAQIKLIPGENLIEASVAGASDQITLVRPKVDPPKVRIIIDSPKDGEITGRRVLAVEGRVENVGPESITLTVNGKAFQVQTTPGTFQSKVTLLPGKNSIRASLGNVSDEVTVTLQVKNPPDKPPDEPADACSKISCDCKNLKATLSITGTASAGSVSSNSQPSPFSASGTGSQSKRPPQDRQAQCREAEYGLKKNCGVTGKVEGFCPPNASGPNAWPKPKEKKQAGVGVFKKVFAKEKQEGVKKP
ncbi:MAG: hypothetical protein AABO57_28215 [Acidobacteriota bacterium]